MFVTLAAWSNDSVLHTLASSNRDYSTGKKQCDSKYNFLWSELKQGLIVASRHTTSHDLQYMFMVMLPVTTQAGIKLQDFRQTLFHL